MMHDQRLLDHCRLSDKIVKEYAVYKPYLVIFGLVSGMYRYIFKVSVPYWYVVNIKHATRQWKFVFEM